MNELFQVGNRTAILVKIQILELDRCRWTGIDIKDLKDRKILVIN